MPFQQTVMRCGHCGNTTAFQVVGTVESPRGGMLRTIGDEAIQWRVLRCPVCKKPTVDETYSWLGADGEGNAERHVNPALVLYPPEPSILTNLPERVDKAYSATLRVKHEPGACAVYAGRTLEAVCNHEQATGGSLMQKLNSLAANGSIPQHLAEMGQQLRIIRNLGAHDAEDEVTAGDVPVILDFLEAILEYLYVAPAKIAAVQKRLQS